MPARRKMPLELADTAAARRRALTVVTTMAPSSGLHDEALRRGWRLLSLPLLNLVLPAGVEPRGALVDVLPDDKVILPLRRRGCPMVRLGNLPHPQDGQVPAVLPDLAAEGRLAARHFAERRFRDVGYVGSIPWSDARTFYEAFRDAAENLGMTCHLCRFGARPGEARAAWMARKRRAVTAWLREAPRPLGLLARGPPLAATYSLWAAEAGYRVPEDVAVLSRGGAPEICGACLPTLSSIDPDGPGRLRIACDLLARMMKGERPPERPILVPPRGITERESTNLIAVPDQRVAAALRYLWAHLDKDTSVNNVADAVGTSRRTLERTFRLHLGRSIVTELRRKRVEELCRLLRTTDLTLAELAPVVGFRNQPHLHTTFRRALGMTPRQYRMRNGPNAERGTRNAE